MQCWQASHIRCSRDPTMECSEMVSRSMSDVSLVMKKTQMLHLMDSLDTLAIQNGHKSWEGQLDAFNLAWNPCKVFDENHYGLLWFFSGLVHWSGHAVEASFIISIYGNAPTSTAIVFKPNLLFNNGIISKHITFQFQHLPKVAEITHFHHLGLLF